DSPARPRCWSASPSSRPPGRGQDRIGGVAIDLAIAVAEDAGADAARRFDQARLAGQARTVLLQLGEHEARLPARQVEAREHRLLAALDIDHQQLEPGREAGL